MHIVQLTSEAVPYAKTGGLADVVGALSRALVQRGHVVDLVLPLYSSIDRRTFGVQPTGIRLGTGLPGHWEAIEVFKARSGNGSGGPNVWLLGHPLFNRSGLYGDKEGDFPDNHLRFAAFCHAAIELILKHIGVPDILHLHDWQTGLAAVRVKELEAFHRTKVVFTIHNLAYAGTFGTEVLDEIGLPRRLDSVDALHHWGRLSLLKGGLVYADRVTTVSPRYAQEIQTPEFGYGFDGLLRYRRASLSGILNGIDEEEWNPGTDQLIAAHYDRNDLSGKARCKEALQQEMGLATDSNAPLFGVVSRLAWQKGIDLIAELAESICSQGGQLAILGTGEPGLEGWLAEVSRRLPGRCAVRLTFDEGLAHRIVAGSDLLLVPSRYEPCGLTQMYALRYGTVPVVRSVGGLDDTVDELDSARQEGNGFKFGAATASAFWAAIQRALQVWGQRAVWTDLAQRGMTARFSWDESASAYEDLYAELTAAKAGAPVAPESMQPQA